MKKAAAVTADSMMVDSSTLNPVFWGLTHCAQACFWALCGLACLGFCVHCFYSERKLAAPHKAIVKKPNKNLLCSSRLKPWLKITGPEAELPPNSASFSLPLASFLLLTRSPDTCPLTQTLCFPRQCECNISHLLIHSLHLLSLQIVINTFRVQKWAFIYSPPACFLILGGIKEGSLTTCSFLGAGDAGSHSDKVHCVLHNKHISKSQNKFIWYECVL